MNYFFDTYAIIEILKGNKSYQKYAELTFITTTLNLSEFYFYLLSNLNEKKADEVLDKFNFSFLEIDKEVAKEAAKFRKINYKRKLSYVDCVGYILSKKIGFKFLTGDEFFENLENVEFAR
ncbi:MAG: PIN domain-containing protein [Nanoarchaeota archaeon]|nr:PIN domain-containing protein [Nanoarchaeota archaeon]